MSQINTVYKYISLYLKKNIYIVINIKNKIKRIKKYFYLVSFEIIYNQQLN